MILNKLIPLAGLTMSARSAAIGNITNGRFYDGSSTGASNEDACMQLESTLKLDSTEIVNISYVPAATTLNFASPATGCDSSINTTATMCRVELLVNTSSTSQLKMEAWLPDEFYGRLLATGNGGLNGCLKYADLAQGTGLHFATVSTNGGHDGATGVPFLNHPEVIKDFAYRSIETEARLGKQIIETYYGNGTLGKSYYTGCSAGGRQGFSAVQNFPDLFDGVVAGAPGLAWNALMGAGGVIATALVTLDVLGQCDGIDGLVDGIIDDPDKCTYRPESLLCKSNVTVGCLTPEKVEAVRTLFSPIYGTNNDLLMPRYDPGVTGSTSRGLGGLGNAGTSDVLDWFRYAIYNDSTWTGANFSAADIEFALSVDPAGIQTFNTDISAFKERGGKLLTYHGTQDQRCPRGNSLRYYNGVSQTLSMPTLDSFYRLFIIPGMEHCQQGPGAWSFGQSGTSPVGLKNDSSSNILLALVDWVEGGVAPDTIVGTKFLNDTVELGVAKQRTYCPYPSRSVLIEGQDPAEAESWKCTRVE